MVDLGYLAKLLPLLKSSGVDSLKMAGLEVTFGQSKELSPSVTSPPLDQKLESPNLTADDTFNFDKILNWSAPPDPSEQIEMPLTGDEPLGVL